MPAAQVELMQTNSFDRPELQEFFGIQARNLNRLSQEGITISFGTDGSSPLGRAPGAGRHGADRDEPGGRARGGHQHLPRSSWAPTTWGRWLAGKSADFIVLDANPLDDITNTRMIDAVYLRGAAMDRDGLGARFRGTGQ